MVLTANVESLGARGDIINVQNGYLKNYLMPQKLAMPATAGMLAYVYPPPGYLFYQKEHSP